MTRNMRVSQGESNIDKKILWIITGIRLILSVTTFCIFCLHKNNECAKRLDIGLILMRFPACRSFAGTQDLGGTDPTTSKHSLRSPVHVVALSDTDAYGRHDD